MTTDRKLENYLSKLEKILAPFPVSDRAEIVMEIKSHVLAALERDPNTKVDSILSALGEPDTVANRYLIERGLKPTKPSLSPIIKWIVIGFLGTFGIAALLVILLLFRFNPLVHVDSNKHLVTLLGGAIQVDGEEGSFWMNDSDGHGLHFGTHDEGFEPVQAGEEIRITFGNGKMEFENSDDDKFSWECEGPHAEKPPAGIKKSDHPVELDLTTWIGSKCQLKVPAGAHLIVKGTNGKLLVEHPHYHVDLALANGKIQWSPDSSSHYKYDISVVNGKSDTFESSSASDAYTIKISLGNGKLQKD